MWSHHGVSVPQCLPQDSLLAVNPLLQITPVHTSFIFLLTQFACWGIPRLQSHTLTIFGPALYRLLDS
jgi:hypothetical protein